ncbi:MAG: hypothetical protein GTO55_06575, partial [Armatimonadetes bacterium]|nr:hypothetical protein [Armatimonadota bacterium]NIM23947.1 hypothetical protein [Armatimonadota bacterium]NIM67794.1 hypothetical protein [Armatimonadota bacterium]NIM76334.1 hypothetical protein [Armatimonadota bacterium]NIN06028.1 hypothetical protein [Armatimonadota bacterium]
MGIRPVWFILSVLIGGVVLLSAACWAGSTSVISDPVATVNGEPISRSRLTERLLSYHGIYVLENLIAEVLLEAEAKKRGVTISEKEVTEAVDTRKKALGIQSEASFQSWLLQHEYTEKRVRDEARIALLLEKVFAQEANVTDAEVEAYYNRNKASFTVPASAMIWRLSARTEEIAQKALELLRAGSDFPAVANELGPRLVQASQSAFRVPLAGLPGSMRAAIENTRVGDLSGPLKVPQVAQDPDSPAIEYWVVKVEEVQRERLRGFSEVKEEIRRDIFRQRVFGPFGIGKRWLEEERQKAVIERFIAFT